MSDELDLTGAAAPPLANGELVFEVPWQGRVFGMARALAEQGVFGWDEFRAELIAAVGRWDAAADRASDPGDVYTYYDRFLEALERLLESRGLLEPGALRARLTELENRPHGHDH